MTAKELEKRCNPTQKTIINAVVRRFNIESYKLFTKSKEPNIVYARSLSMILLNDIARMSFKDLGYMFGCSQESVNQSICAFHISNPLGDSIAKQISAIAEQFKDLIVANSRKVKV